MNQITIYTPESSFNKPGKLIREMFRDLAASRELAVRLAKRDISAMYRQSLLGYVWAFLLPLLNTLIWLFLQGSGIVKIADTGMPYSVYVFSGTILWQIFTESMQSPLLEVTAAKGMLSKLNFPKEAIILSGILKTSFNALIKIAILIPAIIILGVVPDWKIIFFPLAILSLMTIGTTIGLFLSPIGTLYNDIGKGIPFLTQFLMYFCPVVFAMPASGWTATLFQYNILTPLILTGRALVTGTSLDYLFYTTIVFLAGILLLFMAWLLYRITMPILVERMSA
jgi:lipopolysaccharide transport system permease protein